MASPKYRHVRSTGLHSPSEIKETIRKSYQIKVRQKRDSFFNSNRDVNYEEAVKCSLKHLWREMISDDYEVFSDDDACKVLKEIEEELLQEELNRVMEDYENADGLLLDDDCLNQVVCPVCQKANVKNVENVISCSRCNFCIKTSKSVKSFKEDIEHSLDKHNCNCKYQPQFTIVPELNVNHLYLFCDNCSEMYFIV